MKPLLLVALVPYQEYALANLDRAKSRQRMYSPDTTSSANLSTDGLEQARLIILTTYTHMC